MKSETKKGTLMTEGSIVKNIIFCNSTNIRKSAATVV
mgnify:CR=1 FL=1